MFNKPISDQPIQTAEAGLLIKSSRLSAALGVTKFVKITEMNLVPLCCAA
jgi:hypothetical protein